MEASSGTVFSCVGVGHRVRYNTAFVIRENLKNPFRRGVDRREVLNLVRRSQPYFTRKKVRVLPELFWKSVMQHILVTGCWLETGLVSYLRWKKTISVESRQALISEVIKAVDSTVVTISQIIS